MELYNYIFSTSAYLLQPLILADCYVCILADFRVNLLNFGSRVELKLNFSAGVELLFGVELLLCYQRSTIGSLALWRTQHYISYAIINPFFRLLDDMRINISCGGNIGMTQPPTYAHGINPVKE